MGAFPQHTTKERFIVALSMCLSWCEAVKKKFSCEGRTPDREFPWISARCNAWCENWCYPQVMAI